MFEVSEGEMEALARAHGLSIVRMERRQGDGTRRPGYAWTIATMPANFTRHPNLAERVFKAAMSSARIRGAMALDADTLAEFGLFVVPGHVWRAMQRLGA